MRILLPYPGELSLYGGDRDMKNLVLIGMMGCGKSTCGRLLAEALGRTFLDTDALIEFREDRSVPEIFARDGEACFRGLEQRLAEELSAQENLVIACGGGLPTVEDAIRPLADTGLVLFLERDPADIFRQVPMSGRPLGKGDEAAFLARYAKREPIYRRWADRTVAVQPTPQETVDLILEGLDL